MQDLIPRFRCSNAILHKPLNKEEFMMKVQRCHAEPHLWVIFLAGVVCLALARTALGETCEGDKLTIPDSTTLSSSQSLAEAGDTHAQAQMGAAYFRGKGIAVDRAKALTWLEKSAKGGNSEGQYLLGETIALNAKSEGDFQISASWLQKSADQGCIPALFYLGGLNLKGMGVPKNTEAGIRMITEAAEAGYTVAQTALGTILITGNEGINKDIGTGFDWIKRAADAGDSASEIVLAALYLEGIGTERNFEKTRGLLESVYAKKDDQSPTAAFQLGWMYMEGKGVPVDNVRAFQWMYLAAQAHYADSEKRLKTLINELPKQKLATSCGVYEDSKLATIYPKGYGRANLGDTVAPLHLYTNSASVYFPDRKHVGFISRKCLAN